MNSRTLYGFLTIAVFIGVIATWNALAAESISGGKNHDYVTIRWAGRDNTHLIRPGGEVEFIGAQLRSVKKPDRTDDRAFYMNVAINGLAQEGYDVVTATHDEVILRRPVGR